jgi:hypothetical protein
VAVDEAAVLAWLFISEGTDTVTESNHLPDAGV